MKLKIIFFFLLILFFWPKNKSWGEDHHLELKWLLANPISGSEEVFIYNPTDKNINLQGWQIDDVPRGSQPISLSGYLASNSGLLIKLPKAIFNNSGDSCRLLDQGQVIDETTYSVATKGDYWLKDKTGHWCFTSFLPSSLPTFLCSQDKNNSSATPFLEKSYVFPASRCFSLKITKVDPAPLPSEKEKIKIYNSHHFPVDLTNYQLDDEIGGSQPLDLEGVLEEGEEKTISLPASMWNNSGDDIRLLCDSKLIDGVSYQKIVNHQILVLDKNNKWCFYDRSYWSVDRSGLDCSFFQEGVKKLPLVTSRSSGRLSSHHHQGRKKQTAATDFIPHLEMMSRFFSLSLAKPVKKVIVVKYFFSLILLYLSQSLIFLVLLHRRRKRYF